MILYIQTPAIPRSELHNETIKGMIEHLDTNKQFSEIHWFINIDNIKSSNMNGYAWEDVSDTILNFESIANKLTKTTTHIHISHSPCFYLAFRYLTLTVLADIDHKQINKSDFCVMWLEDDWFFTDKELFDLNLNRFLENDSYLTYILHKNKINMGGNPDIIKGSVFALFEHVNLSIDNKRDPENIRKFDVWYPNIFVDPTNNKLDIYPFNNITAILTDINDNYLHWMRKLQISTLSSNVVNGDIGDHWRANLNISKNWSYSDKLGINASRSYTYK